MPFIFLNTQVVNSAYLKPFKHLCLFIYLFPLGWDFQRFSSSQWLPINPLSISGALSIEKSRHRSLSSNTLAFPGLIQCRPTPYCLPWPSSTILDCILCTSHFCALSLSIPASFPRYPSHTRSYSARGKKERREQFQTRRHKSHVQSSLISLPSRRTSLVHSSVRQCPWPQRDEGFFPLEHEKDCQIIRNPTLPTEPTAWALDTYAPAEVVGWRTNESRTADPAKRRESVLGKCCCPDLSSDMMLILCLSVYFSSFVNTRKR